MCYVYFTFVMSGIMLGNRLRQGITCTCICLVQANDPANGGLCSHDNSRDAVLLKQDDGKDVYGTLHRSHLENLQLYNLKRLIADTEQWIAERKVAAGSHEFKLDIGHDRVSTFHNCAANLELCKVGN